LFHRESGYYKTSYAADMALYPLPIARWTVAAIALVMCSRPVLPARILRIGDQPGSGRHGRRAGAQHPGRLHRADLDRACGIHVGGAYTAANLAVRMDLPFWITLPAGGLMAAAVGAVVGIPSLRIRGLYLAIATLAGQLIIEWTINHVPWISGGVQASIEVARPMLFGTQLKTQFQLYWFLLFFAVLAIVGTLNLVRSRIGRAFIAIRDHDIAAEIIGINIFRYKLFAFAISSFYAGVTGVLYTYYLGIANYEQFTLITSVDYLAMIIIGGLGSILGSIFGAIFVTLLPIVIRLGMENWGSFLFGSMDINNLIPNLRLIGFGGLIIVFLVLEPEGLNRLWRNIRSYFRVWPFSY
jgi:branched-chain amino acid transport system permease protein